MRVAIINAVFPPEPVVSAQIGRDLAEELTLRGVATQVVCPFPTRSLGVNYSASLLESGIVNESAVDGYAIARVPSFTAPASNLIGRLRESWSFGRQSCAFLSRQSVQPDVIYANTWPLMAQHAIAAYALRRKIPLVLHIQDVYPESWLNKIPRSAAMFWGAILRRLEKRIVHRATRLVVVSESMRRLYNRDRGLPLNRLYLCHNWQDEGPFSVLSDSRAARQAYAVPEDRFTFLYLGNIGPVAGVEELILAFGVAAVEGAQLVIVGDGSRKGACMELAAKMNLAEVRFVSDPEARNVARLQSMADVCLLPQRKGAGQSSIPSKLSAYLFSAKPIIGVLDRGSDTAACICAAGCGWVEEPGEVDELSKRMRQVIETPTQDLRQMGENGRMYGLEHFSRQLGALRLTEIVMGAGLVYSAVNSTLQSVKISK